MLPDRLKTILPGVALCLMVAAAARFLSEHYEAPVMLYALLLGMALNFLSTESRARAGIEFTARTLLRVGVALLGLRLTLGDMAALGWEPVAIVVTAVTLTILVSVAAARALGFNPLFGLLSGGATAICGASAALALAAALPAHPGKERATLFTVIGVSALSTLAMIAYPLITRALGFDDHQAGIFLGGTIHDVAQVVGAGYSLSREAGDTATVVKLMRVAMLLPVIMVAVTITRRQAPSADGTRPPLLPWFAVAFLALAAVNSTGWVPATIRDTGAALSQWCLVAAIVAIGMKTELGKLIEVGMKPILLMILETLFMAALVLGLLYGLA